jgi:hypothetical protein
MKKLGLIVFILFLFVLGGLSQKIKHPCLVFTPERIQQAKQRIKADPKWLHLGKSSKRRPMQR